MNSYMKIPDIPRLSITPRVDSDWIILTPFWPPQGPGNVAFKNLQVRIQPFDRELHLLDDILKKKNPLKSIVVRENAGTYRRTGMIYKL